MLLFTDPDTLPEPPPPAVPCATVAPVVEAVAAVVPADTEALLSDTDEELPVPVVPLLLFSFSTAPPEDDAAAGVVVLVPVAFSL